MFRLAYDLGDLAQTADEIVVVVEMATEIEKHHRRMASQISDCGNRELSDATYDFLDKWAYGMQVIAQDAQGLADALGDCAATYTQVDSACAAALAAWR